MAQELEDLLIKVDSELGDLNGIDSAVDALNRLAQFSNNATKGARSLNQMASALSQLSSFGKSKINVDKLAGDITKLKGSLEELANFSKDASKSIKQLSKLGQALGTFTNIGKNLAGINQVVQGISKMVDVLDKLSKVEKDATKNIDGLRHLGEALHSFNGLDDNVKGINDIAIGLLNLAKATDAFKGKSESDFKYITDLGQAINTFTDTMNGRKWGFVGQATQGLANLTQALKDTTKVDIGAIGSIAEEIKKFNDPQLMNNVPKITSTLEGLTKTLSILGASSSSVRDTMNKMISGFEQADKGFYNVRSSIEAIAFDFKDSLEPVKNSDLFETLEKFKRLNDSYKNVGGLGQGLGSLISALDMLGGRDLNTSGLTQILDYFKKLAEDKTADVATQEMEKMGKMLQPIASLVNALKYTDFDEKNNVLAVLSTQITKFYQSIPKDFDKFSYVMYAIRDLIQLASDAKAFGVEIPEDNVISQISRSLEGFKGLGDLKDLSKFVEGLGHLISYLTSTQKALQSTSKDVKDSFWQDTLDVTPIIKVGEALQSLKGLSENLASFKTFRDTLMGFSKFGVSNLKGVDLVLERIFETMEKIPEGRGDTLKGLASSVRALTKLEDIDPNQLNLIADGLTKILTALGGIQGSNNRINIRLDSSGVANFEKVVESTSRSWDDFSARLKEDLEKIDISSMFNMDGSRRELEKSLKEAESMLRQRRKTIEEENAKMLTSKQTRQNFQDSSVFQTQVSKYTRARVEAEQLVRVIEHLREAMASAPRFDSDAEGYRYIHNLRQEYVHLEETMKRITKNGSADIEPSSRNGQVVQIIQERMDAINEEIRDAFSALEGMESTEEGIAYRAREIADEWNRVADNAERASQEMRGDIGKGFGDFGKMLSGSKNPILGSFGNLSNMFGKAVQDGTAKLGSGTLASLQGVANVLGKVATAIGQVGAVVSVVLAVFKTWWGLMEKIKASLVQFVQKLIQFAKDMLTKVVGAFNAVSGAVSKVASAVRSGAEIVTSALRKIGDFSKNVISIFGKIGSALAPAVEGIKKVFLAISPSFVKTLASSNFQLKKIIKNAHLLTGAIKSITRYFSMLTRMLMRKSITAFLNSMKQAFEDMVLFEKNAEDQMLQLNYNVSIVFSAFRRLANQVMAIFEPIINAIAVPVETFLTGLQTMAENTAKFMAILTGQPYYLRAKKFYEDYGQNVEDTTKKVKNLTNGLDELNILNDKSSSSTETYPLPEDMFEKVPIDGSFDGIKIEIQKILDWIKDKLRNIDWAEITKKAREFVKRLFEIINTILRDKEFWQLLGKTVGEIINFLFAIVNEAVHDLDWKALGQAIAEFIKNALESIDWALIRDTVIATAKGIATTWNEIFADKQLWKDLGETVAHTINDVIVAYLDSFAWTFNFKNFADAVSLAIKTALEGINWEQIRHAVDGWTQGIVTVVNEWAHDKKLWEDIGNTIKHTINDVFINAFNDLGNIDFANLTERIKEAIEKALDINWNEFNEGVKKWGENLADIINGFFGDEGFLSTITTSIAKFTNGIISLLDTFLEKLKAYDIGKAIAEALGVGNGAVDWETAFTLPAKAINKLSDAIRGFLDGLPEDFNLGTWLTEHLNLTLENINWDEIEKNLDELSTKIGEWLNGLLENEEFWTNAGKATGRVLNIGVNFLFNLVNFDGEDLGTAITNYVNGLIDRFDIGDVLRKTVDVAINLVVALDVALQGIDWKTIGDQITQGIIDAIDRIYQNRGLIVKTINDFFAVFNKFINNLVNKMIANNSFAKIGEIIGSTLLAVINGVANFFTMNTDSIVTGMKQLADSLALFIDEHEQEIVDGLNTIIDGIVAIINTFLDEKSALYSKFISIVEQLHLEDLISVILRAIIQGITASLKMNEAIWESLTDDLDELVDALWNALSPILSYIGEKLKEKIKEKLNPFEKTGGGLLGLGDVFKGDESLGDWFKNTLDSLVPDWMKGTENGARNGVKWDIDLEPNLNAEGIEEVRKEAEEYFAGNEITVETGVLFKDKSAEINAKLLDIEEILAKTLTLTDILADKLKVKELEVEGKDELNGKDLPNYFGANAPNAQGGTLSKDAEFEKITAKLLEITEKITAPLLEVAEKVTAPLLEIAEKIITKLLEVSEKVTTPLLEALQITTPLLIATELTAMSISAMTINASLMNVSDILANTLKVGTIEGTLSGGTSGGGYPVGIGSFTLPSYEGWENIYSDIQMPNFAVGERWSDISGLAPSAEDFLNGLDNTYSDVVNSVTTAYNELPRYLGGSGSTASGGTLSKNGSTGLSAFDKKMADTLAGAKINNLPSNAEYIRDYLMGFIGNEAGVYGLMGNLYAESGLLSNNLQDTKIGEGVTQKDIDYTNKANANGKSFINDSKGYGLAQWTTSDRKKAFYESLNGRSVDDLDAQLEYLKSELMSSQYKNVLDKLRNASSIEEASDATLYGFEKPNVKSEATAGLRLAYGQDIAGQLGSYDGEVNIEDEETPTTDGMKNFDEVNVIGGKGGGSNPLSFLSSLPLQTEYLMAQVYDIIDKWLGRIWKLLKSFQIPDDLKKWLDALQNGDLSEIKIPVLDELKALIEQLNRLIAELTDVLREVKDTIEDLIEAINKLKDSLGESSSEAHASAEAWDDSVNDITNAINSLGDRLSNIKCECDCNCCNGCNGKGGGKPTPSNNVTDIPSGGTSKGGGTSTPSIKNIGDTPTPTSSTPSGGISKGGITPTSPINYTPSTIGGKVGGGQGNIDLNMPYGSVPMYALIDGKLVRLNDNLPDSVKKLIASGQVPITDAKGNEISSGDRSTMLGYLKGKGWLGDVDEDWLKNLRQSATNIKSDLLTPWENDITNQDKKDNYYQAKDLTDKLRQDGLSESEYKDTYDKLKQLATDSGLSSDKYADSDIPTTYSKDLEEYLGMPTVNESGDGGWLTNPANDTSEEEKEYGVNTLDTQYRTDPESKTNIQDTIDKIKENQEKEDKGSKGAGTSKYDKETGITTYYDADGNEKGTYNTKTGEYSGDTIYARLSKAEKEKADKWAEQVKQNKEEREKKQSEKSANNSIIDKDKILFVGDVTDDVRENKASELTKQVEDWRSQAKNWLDTINKYGTDAQKKSAQSYYDSLMQNKAVGNVSPYQFNYEKIRDIANKIDNPDDISKQVSMYVGSKYSGKGNAIVDAIGAFSKSILEQAVSATDSQLVNASATTIHFKGKDGKKITDSSTLAKIKDYIVSKFGITPKTSNSNVSATQTSGVTSGTVTKDAGTVTESGQSFIDKFKEFIDKGNPFKTGYGTSSKDSPLDATKAQQLFEGKRNLAWVGYVNDKGLTFDSSNPNYKLPANKVKEAFDYWYKNRFLVKGYQMGGTPNSGELYMARENGSNEFIGSFGNKSVVANNEQIVTAVANGVSMANDRVVSAIQSQTGSLENAIDRKNLDVQIGDRQIAEANRRGEKGLGGNMVQ